ncbi:alpha-isopropylmalate synthase regulatory domain-containing protein, partial [Streptomyces sp. NPDC056672]
FSRIIQAKTDAEGGEVTPGQIWSVFQDEYLPTSRNTRRRLVLRSAPASISTDGTDALTVAAVVDGERVILTGKGNGPISAFVDALAGIGIGVRVLDYSEHAMTEGARAQAASYVECAVEGQVLWGIGIDASATWASLEAVTSAVNRAWK